MTVRRRGGYRQVANKVPKARRAPLEDVPDSYEALVAREQREHPQWTRAEVEAYIAREAGRVNDRRRPEPGGA